MEEKGFKKKPRLVNPQAAFMQVVDNPGGSRPGGKAGGHRSSKARPESGKQVGMCVVGGRVEKAPPDVKDHISRQLKAIYDEMLSQPVPNRFLDLLSKLDQDSDR